uniref:Melanocortin 2 receptor accessory protein n=1 Tax=Molossus molossus TaxID=27622 RepID=A0A7J8IZF7_MOLMO|nr:hypothetical protein HJG59_010344 [Molossus molossus]
MTITQDRIKEEPTWRSTDRNAMVFRGEREHIVGEGNPDSIVIGFWVGLAVFVIFMFFVLTLLTKTEALHQDNAESSEKRYRMNSFMSDFGKPLEPDKVFSQQGNEESRSLFHCYINEVGHLEKAKVVTRLQPLTVCSTPGSHQKQRAARGRAEQAHEISHPQLCEHRPEHLLQG